MKTSNKEQTLLIPVRLLRPLAIYELISCIEELNFPPQYAHIYEALLTQLDLLGEPPIHTPTPDL